MNSNAALVLHPDFFWGRRFVSYANLQVETICQPLFLQQNSQIVMGFGVLGSHGNR